MTPKPKLLDQVRQAIRVKNYSYRTEQAYVLWVRRYILYHDRRHPAEMGEPEVEAFLTYLAAIAKPVSPHPSSSRRSGSSTSSFTRTRNCTASRPSTIRWS